jgi:hypothetical protein
MPHNRHGHPIGPPCAGEIACSRALQIMEDSALRNPGISADTFPCFIETPHPLDFPVVCAVKNPGHLVKTYGLPGAMMSASSPTKARDISLHESRLSDSTMGAGRNNRRENGEKDSAKTLNDRCAYRDVHGRWATCRQPRAPC